MNISKAYTIKREGNFCIGADGLKNSFSLVLVAEKIKVKDLACSFEITVLILILKILPVSLFRGPIAAI